MLPGMRAILRWLRRGLLAALALALLLLAGAAGLVWLTLPGMPARTTLPGLGAAVEVRFDEHAIPRIRAGTEADAWRALGLLHARDRLFQMELMRRGATGRLAEISGAGALRLDRYMRLLDLERHAEADLAVLPAETREALDAYAAGVNAWIAARGRMAAPEFLLLGPPAPWRPVDSLLWGKVMSLWLSGSWRMELDRLRLAAILPPERLAELWPEDRSPGRPDLPADGVPAATQRGAARMVPGAIPGRVGAGGALPPPGERPWIGDAPPRRFRSDRDGEEDAASSEASRNTALRRRVASRTEADRSGLRADAASPEAVRAHRRADFRMAAGLLTHPNDPSADVAAMAAEPLDRAMLARIAAQLPRFPGEAPLPSSASNAWAVAPTRSASGGALLAADPHLGYGAPIQWYLARIELPGGRFLAGATAPGVPGVLIGRNERLAWGFTTTQADAQDVVIERLAGPDAYDTPEGPRPFALREAMIRVRGADPVTARLRESRHGPILSDLDPAPAGGRATVLALALATLAPGDRSATGLLALNRAGSIAEAREAAALLGVPQNLVVADAAGGIALFVTGRIPLRRVGDGSLPVQGWDGPAWTGFAPFDALPHVVNPPSGMVANANNRVSPPHHPVLLTRDWPGDWRFRRIAQLLAARERHDAAGFGTMQADTLSLFATDALPAFRSLPRPSGAAGLALDLLLAWDGRMAADGAAPLIFHATLRRLARAALGSQGVPEDAAAGSAEFLALLLRPDGRGAPWCGAEGCPAMLATAFGEAVAALAAEHGPDPAAWRWGPAHVARFEHPLLRHVPGLAALTRLATPSAGDGETLMRGAFRGGAGFEAVHGAGFRGVFDLASPAGAFGILATGQSGHPMSRHFGDQLAPWRDGHLLPLGPMPGAAGPVLRLEPAR